MALDTGDERRILRATNSMTADLSAEGPELPAWAALERARERGVPNVATALADVAARGAGGVLVRAVVRHPAGQLAERTGSDPLRMGWKPWPPPDLRRRSTSEAGCRAVPAGGPGAFRKGF